VEMTAMLSYRSKLTFCQHTETVFASWFDI
jgi:hypothetical protein